MSIGIVGLMHCLEYDGDLRRDPERRVSGLRGGMKL